MDVRSIAADVLFRACFTACPLDPKTLLIDVRSAKVFKRKHILQAFCIRLTASGETLLDYSGASYDQKWSKDCWWDKPVIVYGDNTVDKGHPVVAFLAKEKRAKSVSVYKEGFEVFEEHYPFLCTQSVKANAAKTYPGEIVPGLLYLGNWEHAQDFAALHDLGIERIISIHNNPENLQPPKAFQQLKMTVADVHTQDITPFFNPSYDYIEEARAKNEGVLVHCGAGVSRSASLCIAYLMRRNAWNAAKARKHCQQRRSLVNPNDGFWRSLCAFEQVLGITDRSDPGAGAGGQGADAPALLSEDAAGQKVKVSFVPISATAGPSHQQPAANSSQTQGVSPDRKRKRDSKDGSDGSQDNGNDIRHGDDRVHGSDRSDRHHKDDSDSRRRHGEEHDKGDRHRGRGRDEGGSKGSKHSRHSRRHSSGSDSDRSPKRAGEHGEGGRAAAAGAADDDRAQDSAEEAEIWAVVLDVGRNGKQIGQLKLDLAANQRCVFGRQPGGCDVVMEHLSVSRQHAHLSMDVQGRCFITDMASGHGTNVDGLWLRPKAPRGLQLGSVIKLGASSRVYTVAKLPKT